MKPLRALFVEDNADDAELLVRTLAREGYETSWRRVDTDADMRRALIEEEWDLVFCDWSMPSFDAPSAIEVLHQSRRDVPLIIVSGTVGEETAVAAMRTGAQDFLVKGQLTRLGAVVDRELSDAAQRRRRREAERALKRRDAILTAVGSAAERLVRSASWEGTLREVLARIGPESEASRLLVYQNRAGRLGREGALRVAWHRSDVLPAEMEGDLAVLRWSDLTPLWELAAAAGGVGFAVGDPRFQASTWRWMARHDVRSLCLVPIRTGTVWWGAILVLDELAREWSDAEISALRVLGDALGASIERKDLLDRLTRSHADLAQAYDQSLEGWALTLELRDRETAGHTRRVTDMTVKLAQAMGIAGDALVHVRRGALLHDIGKMAVPDAVLLKPGPLTEEEQAVMRRHPAQAHELLKGIPYLLPALEIPYGHHERWDGKGYPRGLAGEEIPLAARIFAVIDSWDAMRSDRPYRAAMSEEDACRELEAGAGTQFDPRVVEAFLALVRGKPLPQREVVRD
jgi:response regulator RpfG family c-di-GMP phosphodiesterase